MDHRVYPTLLWQGKDEAVAAKRCVLTEDPRHSYGDPLTENLLIQGDNLEALNLLKPSCEGKVKCIYIDPPYNTGSAFRHFEDNMAHAAWLNMMKPRLEALRVLLSDEGSLWISIDDDERDYLKVLCDEIFGRVNFVACCIWQKKHTRANDAKFFSDNHDYILVYAKDKRKWKRALLPRGEDGAKGYTNPDNDPRGVWASGPCHVKTPNPKDIFPVTTPSGRAVWPPPGSSWRFSQKRFEALMADNRIWFGLEGNNVPRYKRFLSEVQPGFVPTTLWLRSEAGDNQEAKQEVKAFNEKAVFTTPKPERLMERILTIATQPGDLVLDSFLGSGTTAAVALKMNRRFIGIELGEHCFAHCIPRLRAVVDGETGGISKAVNWQGGGGFRFAFLEPQIRTDYEEGEK